MDQNVNMAAVRFTLHICLIDSHFSVLLRCVCVRERARSISRVTQKRNGSGIEEIESEKKNHLHS